MYIHFLQCDAKKLVRLKIDTIFPKITFSQVFIGSDEKNLMYAILASFLKRLDFDHYIRTLKNCCLAHVL